MGAARGTASRPKPGASRLLLEAFTPTTTHCEQGARWGSGEGHVFFPTPTLRPKNRGVGGGGDQQNPYGCLFYLPQNYWKTLIVSAKERWGVPRVLPRSSETHMRTRWEPPAGPQLPRVRTPCRTAFP